VTWCDTPASDQTQPNFIIHAASLCFAVTVQPWVSREHFPKR
jgi:hypothetical protein